MSIDVFVSDYQKRLTKLTHNVPISDITLLKSNLDRLKRINELLLINKFKLIFIGEPGSGKPTTICNLLGLTKDLEIKDVFSDFELFNTGTGRTTAFEVHYIKSDRTLFKIYPMDLSSQIALVSEYLNYMWNQVFKSNEEDSNNFSDGSSREYDRMIRNMLRFSSENIITDFILSNYNNKTFNDFLDDMIKKIGFENRSILTISLPKNIDVKNWIKDTFDSLNNGKLCNVAIPERVDVHLSTNDINFYMPDFISEVIDTRGYDGNTREDLMDYIRNDDSISILLDRPESLPGERQSKILSEWIIKEDIDIIPRIAMFIKVKDDSLAKVNGADGDEEKGEEIKKSELERTVKLKSLNYMDCNTLFIDSYFGIVVTQKFIESQKTKKKSRKSIVVDYDEKIRNDERDRANNHLLRIITDYKSRLKQEAIELQETTAKLYQDISSPSIDKQISDSLKKTIDCLSTLKDVLADSEENEISSTFNNCVQYFCSYFRSNVHWRSAQKTTTMNGRWYNANIYSEYKLFIKMRFINIANRQKERAIAYLIKNEFEELKPFIDSCITKINDDYLKMLQSIQDSCAKLTEEAFTSRFWKEAQMVQRGTGYYDRLMLCIERQMYKTLLLDKTIETIYTEVEKFFDGTIKLLNDKIQNL